MKTFNYTISSNMIWTSFDYGTVEAENEAEARKKAIEKLTYDFKKVNEVLASADVTQDMTIEFDENQVEITEKD